jgi:hypothetical protein
LRPPCHQPWRCTRYSVSLAHRTGGERCSTIHVVINGPDSKEHTGSHDLITAIHQEKSILDLILDSLNLGHPFYFLRLGKHTPSRYNLVRRSRMNDPRCSGFNEPWTAPTDWRCAPGPLVPWTYSIEFSLEK